MKFTLKDYQEDAVRDVLKHLGKARKDWRDGSYKTAFALTATTGAGKTVMAAAVFEALFFGNDDYDFEPDPGAVVIWFSDDPALNEQSRFRLYEASDTLLIYDQLVVVENTFNHEEFEPGKIYFLNTQKLSKKSLLVRGHDETDPGVETTESGLALKPDGRGFTIWDTIRNTIENPDKTLYLLLDEAHRGMGEGARSNGSGKPTIVKRLINGTGGVPGIPVVWGISATVDRFNQAIAGMQDKLSTLPNVVVDTKKVQESGLLKDTINLDIPNEVGDFKTVLLRRGADKLKAISKEWADYAEIQGDPNPVLPLMVLQVPNSPDPMDIGSWLDVIFEEFPDLPDGCVANVFGEHKTEQFGKHTVRYITPERVQESHWVRILVAKDAISSGWDCPRAEVMVSFRTATDRTHITQLLGRMVRTPLARRIPGHEKLNAVDCLLPQFNKSSVTKVVDSLMTGGDTGEDPASRRVLINPKEMLPNPDIPEAVWEKLLSLPSQTIPRRHSKPVKRLTALAHELAVDGLIKDAGKKAHAEMHKVLDGLQVQFADEIKAARESVLTVEGLTAKTDVETREMSFNDFVETADFAVIEDAYKRTARIISPDLARTYSEYLAAKKPDMDPEESLIEAHTVIASLGLFEEIQSRLEDEASKLANRWLEQHRVAIKDLKDDRQDVYRQIREMSADPMDVDLARPKSWLQPTVERKEDGTETELPRFDRHLLCDEDGLYPCEFNAWEDKVLSTELGRDKTVAWYRNPARASQDSLGITYLNGDEAKVVRPDFIFFSQSDDGSIAADIVDPHSHHLSDALPKLQGLARYAEQYGAIYRRIDAVTKIDDRFKALDLKEETVRQAVFDATSAKDVFVGEFANNYEV
ncbi:DEAD/DEAH box helicase family protein [bacterium]|nr:DEAD/DEAH box helicase family protein [bacterium]